LLLGLIAVWGLALRVKTPNGTIDLVNLPRDAEVFVDGAEVAVTWPGGGKPAVITVPAGQRRIAVKKDGIQVFGDEVTVQAGNEPFTVRLAPLADSHPPNLDSASREAKVAEREADRREAEPSPVAEKKPDSKNERPAPVVEPEFLTTRTGQIKLKRIPAGKFLMGSPVGVAEMDEHPQHEVQITRPFYLGVYEVTQGQYRAVMGNNPSGSTGSDDSPVKQVLWLDAVKFCNRLSEREGRKPYYRIEVDTQNVTIAGGDGYRLPTEAEWEYACGAGTTTRYSFGDDENALGQYAWYGVNSGGRTHPVGAKQPNAFGLYDMHGNVWELCWDWYNPDYYKQSPLLDPQGPERAVFRVIRGGCWRDIPRLARSAFRYKCGPEYRGSDVGFRVARVQSSP
jgi:formylglycine-generating enzyme required for sulfatase activity